MSKHIKENKLKKVSIKKDILNKNHKMKTRMRKYLNSYNMNQKICNNKMKNQI